MIEHDVRSSFTAARHLAHHACQWPSRAARANLAPRPDDGHSALHWHTRLEALVCEPFGDTDKFACGFRFTDAALLWLRDDSLLATHPIRDADDAVHWLDERLADAGLARASTVAMPYELETAAEFASAPALVNELRTLGRTFATAHQLLCTFVSELPPVHPGPSPIRCWPHHFDIATLIALEVGEPEVARAVGVGVSPGDQTIAEPYAYVSAWPTPDAGSLRGAPAPFVWHTSGFVALVTSFGALATRPAPAALLRDAFDVSRSVR